MSNVLRKAAALSERVVSLASADAFVFGICIAASITLPPSAIAGESQAAPEMVVITARPPDPVGNAAFSTTLLSEQQSHSRRQAA